MLSVHVHRQARRAGDDERWVVLSIWIRGTQECSTQHLMRFEEAHELLVQLQALLDA